MPLSPRIQGVDDSKQLSKKQREHVAQKIVQRALCYGIGIVPHDELDRIGITAANELAMTRAIAALTHQPDYVLIDAFDMHRLPMKHKSIAHGDATVYSIAAASIIAKVYRDKLMDEYDVLYPLYGFATNKGYGTSEHNAAIGKHGVSPIHRMSFQPMKTMV
jgi:ribonuclease HII